MNIHIEVYEKNKSKAYYIRLENITKKIVLIPKASKTMADKCEYKNCIIYSAYTLSCMVSLIFRKLENKDSTEQFHVKSLARFILVGILHLGIFFVEMIKKRQQKSSNVTFNKFQGILINDYITEVLETLMNIGLIIIYEETKQELVYEAHIIYLINFLSRMNLNELFSKKNNIFISIAAGEVIIPHFYLIFRGQINFSNYFNYPEKQIRFSQVLCLSTSLFVLILIVNFKYESIQKNTSKSLHLRSREEEEILNMNRSDPSAMASFKKSLVNGVLCFHTPYQKQEEILTQKQNSDYHQEPNKMKKLNITDQKDYQQSSMSNLFLQIFRLFHNLFFTIENQKMQQSIEKQFINLSSSENRSENADISSSVHTFQVMPSSLKNTQTFGQIAPSLRYHPQTLTSTEGIPSINHFMNYPQKEKGHEQIQSNIFPYQTKTFCPIQEEEQEHQSLLIPLGNFSSALSSQNQLIQASKRNGTSQNRSSITNVESPIQKDKFQLRKKNETSQEKKLIQDQKYELKDQEINLSTSNNQDRGIKNQYNNQMTNSQKKQTQTHTKKSALFKKGRSASIENTLYQKSFTPKSQEHQYKSYQLSTNSLLPKEEDNKQSLSQKEVQRGREDNFFEEKNNYNKSDFTIEESLSKAFFNFFPEGVAFLDSQMNILYANDSLQKFFCSGISNLKEKLFSLKNDLNISEISQQKSSRAQNFLIKNLIGTDINIQSPKSSSKIKSHNNITQEMNRINKKCSFKLNSISNFNQLYNQQLISSNSCNYAHPSTFVNLLNENSNISGDTHSQNNFANILFLQNQKQKSEQKSTTSLQPGLQLSFNGQQAKNYNRTVKLDFPSPLSSDQNTPFYEEPLFQYHFPVQDSSNFNVQKKQATLPDLFTELQQIFQEIKRYMQNNSIEFDSILDKSFTFTSHFEIGSQQLDSLTSYRHMSIQKRKSECRSNFSEKQAIRDLNISKKKQTYHSSFFPISSQTLQKTGIFNSDSNCEIKPNINSNESLQPGSSPKLSFQRRLEKTETQNEYTLHPNFLKKASNNTKSQSIIGEESYMHSSCTSPQTKKRNSKQQHEFQFQDQIQEQKSLYEIKDQLKSDQTKKAISSKTIQDELEIPDQIEELPKLENITDQFFNSNFSQQIPTNSNSPFVSSIQNTTIQENKKKQYQGQRQKTKSEDVPNIPSEYEVHSNSKSSFQDQQSESSKRDINFSQQQIKNKISDNKSSQPFKVVNKSHKFERQSSKISQIKSIGQEDKEWGDDTERVEKRELDISIFCYVLNGQPVLLLLVKDVTHRSYIKLLQDVSKKKSKMVSFVSHELRTPLNSIIAMLETMKKQPKLDYIETALMNSKYLLCISNDLLDLAQIQVNKFQIRKKCFNLKELIMETMEMFSIQAQRQQIELIVDYQQVVPSFITSDKNRIRQVLINLIGNAFKFTLNGSISIQVKKLDSALYQVIVLDTGIGIKEQDLNKLFKTFGKLHGEESVKLNEQGVGLGLVISNKIAFSLSEEHEGLKVVSEYSKGTSFHFKILDWDIKQSQIEEEHFQNDNIQMIVEAEEDEGQLYHPIENVQKCQTQTLQKNKFTEGQKQKLNSVIESQEVYSPSKSRDYSPQKFQTPLRQSSTLEVITSSTQIQSRNKMRLKTDLLINWAEKKKLTQQSKEYNQNKDYNILSFNRSENQSNIHLGDTGIGKFGTHISIKEEWGDILIVDDNMSNILAMKCLISLIDPLLKCNYAIRGNGAEDLVQNRFKQQRDKGYNIIFMDIIMPEQDGIKTAKNIINYLKEKNIQQTKIIGCSGYDDDDEKQNCIDSGMVDYLVKPVFKEKLATILKIYF